MNKQTQPSESTTDKSVDIGNKNPASPKSPWKVNKNTIEELKRSANKYVVLEEIEESEIYGQNWKESVDKYVKNQRQPSKVDAKFWTEEMHEYYKVQWMAMWEKERFDEDVYDEDSGMAMR